MAKVMKCRTVGLDCDFVARGENDDQVMAKFAEHARKDHGMQTIPQDVAAKVKAAIQEEYFSPSNVLKKVPNQRKKLRQESSLLGDRIP